MSGMLVGKPNLYNRPPINMYPHLSFEPYRFIQFPEWVTPPHATRDADGTARDENGNVVAAVLCHDEEEKQNVMRGAVSTAPTKETDEKTSLYVRAENKGIAVDKRWSLETLRRKVDGVMEPG